MKKPPTPPPPAGVQGRPPKPPPEGGKPPANPRQPGGPGAALRAPPPRDAGKLPTLRTEKKKERQEAPPQRWVEPDSRGAQTLFGKTGKTAWVVPSCLR